MNLHQKSIDMILKKVVTNRKNSIIFLLKSILYSLLIIGSYYLIKDILIKYDKSYTPFFNFFICTIVSILLLSNTAKKNEKLYLLSLSFSCATFPWVLMFFYSICTGKILNEFMTIFMSALNNLFLFIFTIPILIELNEEKIS